MQGATKVRSEGTRRGVRSTTRERRCTISVKLTSATARRLAEYRQVMRDDIGVKPTTFETIGLLLARSLDGQAAGEFEPVRASGPGGLNAWLESVLDWIDADAIPATDGEFFRTERDHVLRVHGARWISRKSRSVLHWAMDLLARRSRNQSWSSVRDVPCLRSRPVAA